MGYLILINMREEQLKMVQGFSIELSKKLLEISKGGNERKTRDVVFQLGMTDVHHLTIDTFNPLLKELKQDEFLYNEIREHKRFLVESYTT